MKVGDWVEFINLDKSIYNPGWYEKYLRHPLRIKNIVGEELWFEKPIGAILRESNGVPLVRPARIELLKALKRHL